MFRTISLLAVLPLTLAACTTMTAEERAVVQEQRAQETQTAEEGGLRCRTIRQTGSRLGNRVCRTDEEWEQMERDAQEGHDGLDRGNVRPSSPDQGFGG
ncbi:hypothetical protein [Hyphobacterium sp.]|uniref:hypothetical protein n=1 Tax=Hyphobacterium sp. TaxID=2004662 RepID=UPI0037479A56